jgi:biotin operon repressor
MVTQTSQNIIEYLKAHSEVTSKQLGDFLAISRQALYKHLSKLLADGHISKIGRPPKVYYYIQARPAKVGGAIIGDEDKKIINENYLIITPSGEKLEGQLGFTYWCQKNSLDVTKTASQYSETVKKFNRYKKDGLVDGTVKMKNTFAKIFLDKVFYLDFYSIERFGKTKLGQMLLYAKQSQNKNLMNKLIGAIHPKILQVIDKYKIDAVGFIPPTVKREVQFMKELQKQLRLQKAVLNLVKVKTEVSVPQKSLGKLEDRVENARETIFVEEQRVFRNVLLIDDAIGSGATMNQVAAKIKEKKIATGKLIGLAITGSFKGFDVISEV